MSFSYTTASLIASVKRRGMIPTSQNTYTDNDFLDIGTEVINSHIAPLLVATREEYYVYPIDRTLVSGTTNYLIPTRAMGDGLRSLFWLTDAGSVAPVTIIDLDSQDALNNGMLLGNADYAAYKQGSEIVIKPAPGANAGSLRFFIHIRPGKLVETTDAAQISAINTATNTVTVTTIPSTWATGNVMDIIQNNPHYRHLDIDLTATVSGSNITFSDLPDALAVGDWVALQGESPIPQIPHELMPMLSQWIVVKCLEGLGDRPGAQYAKEELKELTQDGLRLIQPRVKAEAKKVVNRDRLYLLNRTW